MEIGGYFGLELQQGKQVYHNSSYQLKSGRSAIALILDRLRPSHVYLPYYTCNALLEPFEMFDVSYTFYHIDAQLEIVAPPILEAGALLLYINYYDIKRAYVAELSVRYQDQLLIDCTQAYFLKGNGKSWLFNSCRKFFGVPDGAYLYVPNGYNLSIPYGFLSRNENYLTTQLISRFNGKTQAGYPAFQQNEILNGQEPARMSALTEQLLSHIDYTQAMNRRSANFNFLHEQLKATNQLFIDTDAGALPSFYPYLPGKLIDKQVFWDQDIFVPNFWNDCLYRSAAMEFELETSLSRNMIPIPVDHRYSPADLSRIIELIQTLD